MEYYFHPPPDLAHDLDLSLARLLRLIVPFVRGLFAELRRGYGFKVQVRVQLDMEKFSFQSARPVRIDGWFPSDTAAVMSIRSVGGVLKTAMSQVSARFDSFVQRGSGWSLRKVLQLCLVVNRFKMFRGGCDTQSLPDLLRKSRCCVSVSGSDDQCFIRAVVAGVAGVPRNPQRWSSFYDRVAEKLPVEKLVFPVTHKSLGRFERACQQVSINVYGYEKAAVFPYYLSAQLDRPFHVNLLLYRGHYYLVRNMGALVRPQTRSNRRKLHVCPSCLSTFGGAEGLSRHRDLCRKDGRQFVVPSPSEAELTFASYSNMLSAPFVIYCDLETMIREERVVSEGKVLSKRRHLPVSVAAYVVCRDRPELGAAPYVYTGLDCVDRLLSYLKFQEARLRGFFYGISEPCCMTVADERRFEQSTHCFMCRRSFAGLRKVRDHCHLSGRYRFALCDGCNLTRAKRPFEVLVFFHGLSNYDSHFLVRNLGRYRDDQVTVVPKNSEQYLAFTLGDLRFRDSLQFLQDSLATLVKSLHSKGAHCFRHLSAVVPDAGKRALLLRKGVFPYSYFRSMDTLLESDLPPPAAFRNDLTAREVSAEDYAHARNVWCAFNCSSFRDYLHLYLLSDCLQLADVFENFRDICLRDYALDPAHYFSSPHFTFDAFLRYTGATMDLLSDPDQYLFVSRGIRGGLSAVSKRYSRANNRFVPGYDSSRPSVFILDLDANNLYGWAMRNPLPVGGYRWAKPHELLPDFLTAIPSDAPEGCIVECTLDYPPHLHEQHADYPLAPVKRKVRWADLSPFARGLCDKHGLRHALNSEKLLATFERRERYVLHYRNLQLYVRLGMRLVSVRGALFFRQERVMEPYVYFNWLKRSEAQNEFDVAFYKLLLNSLFGKTIENPEKRTKVRLCRTPEQLERSVSHHSFKSSKVIARDVVGVEMRYPRVKLTKPYPIGMAILDLSKYHMYDFHYNVMKPIFGERIELLYTDTDSLIYEITSDDPYAEVARAGHSDKFDFSNFPSAHDMHDQCNKRVPGKFKDECNATAIREFVGLRSKMYSMLLQEGREVKVAKGVKRAVIQNELKFQTYVDCLESCGKMEHSFRCIRSVSHKVHTFHQSKVSLSSFEDKRYLLDSVRSVPYGHRLTVEKLS